MAIQNRVQQVMLEWAARHGKPLTIRELSQGTGLAESTISRMISQKQQMIDFITLNNLCIFLECTPGDILKLIPDADGKLTMIEPRRRGR